MTSEQELERMEVGDDEGIWKRDSRQKEQLDKRPSGKGTSGNFQEQQGISGGLYISYDNCVCVQMCMCVCVHTCAP